MLEGAQEPTHDDEVAPKKAATFGIQLHGSLPRLLLWSNVPVQAYLHGSTLLYRLFECFPKDKLVIVEHSDVSAAELRIPELKYNAFVPPWVRFQYNRLGHHLWPLDALTTNLYSKAIFQSLETFKPEAVITVVVGHAWEAAARYARREKLPLHLIVHDDWPSVAMTSLQRRWADAALRRWYRKADSRLCVSPYMAEEYFRRYGCDADVLYPSRAINSLKFDTPPVRLGRDLKNLTVAFCGSIYLEYARALQRLAIALRVIGGRLLVFGPESYRAVGQLLREPNIELRGTVSSEEVIARCRNEADALFVPMSYRQEDRRNMEISFPSKLVDYTATGLPLIIDGPPYCSAVRWAQENPGVSVTVTDGSISSLTNALRQLQVPATRIQLANEAIRRGEEYFSYLRGLSVLTSGVMRSAKVAAPIGIK
jgi:glycosyltransferase involved in cell wall biosynthesis